MKKTVLVFMIFCLSTLWGCDDEPENNPPIISSLTAVPVDKDRDGVGGEYVVLCEAGDPDGDDITYSWEPSDGVISGTGPEVAWSVPNSVGRYSVSCVVSDGLLSSQGKEVSIDVVLETCGDGVGYPVEFLRQVDNYEHGFGVPGEDYIVVECVVGPEGATVSNQKNGTYYCSGTYRLSAFNTAEISLNWGGTTRYSEYEEHVVSSPGEGIFSIKVTKISGGAGNMFLSMSSEWRWMFDTVPVNKAADGSAPGILMHQKPGPVSSFRLEDFIERNVPRSYNPKF